MSRLAGRVSLAGMLVVLVIAVAGIGFAQRYLRTDVDVRLDNHTEDAWVARFLDGTSGRTIDTLRIEPWTSTHLTEAHLDVWWRELTATEEAAGRNRHVQVEILGEGCSLMEVSWFTGGPETLHLDEDGGLYSTDDVDERALEPREAAAVSIADPCAGATPTPVARIVNATEVPALIDQRVLVPACSVTQVRAGEVPVAPVGEPPADAADVTIPSLAVQQERWPLSPVSVTISRDGVSEWSGAAWTRWDTGETCRGLPLDRYEDVHDEPYEPYVPPVPSS